MFDPEYCAESLAAGTVSPSGIMPQVEVNAVLLSEVCGSVTPHAAVFGKLSYQGGGSDAGPEESCPELVVRPCPGAPGVCRANDSGAAQSQG